MTTAMDPVLATEVHRLGKDGRQIVYWVFGILGVPIGLMVVLAYANPAPGASPKRMLMLLGGWAVAAGFAWYRSRQLRLEIFPDGFRYVGLFRTSVLRCEDIAGYRHAVGRYGGRSGDVIAVLCDAGGRELLRVTSNLERPQRVREWVREHFRDLDAVDLAEERRILKPGDARKSLSTVRGLTMILNVVGAVLAFLVLLGSAVGVVGPRWILIGGTLLAVPIAALAARARYGRLVSFERTPYRSRFARIEAGLILPMIASWMIVICAPPVRLLQALPWALGAGSLYFLALRRWGGRLLGNAFMAAFFAILSLEYGYGLSCFANAALDRAEPVEQAVYVQKVSHRRGRTTVVVSVPAEGGATRSLTVPKPFEAGFSPGLPARALIMPGALGISWIAAVAPGG